MTTRTIRNGATITVPVETGETLKIVAVTGTYTATIVRGTGIGTALATAATGGSYGPYAYAVVVSIVSSASSEIDFDVAVTPDVVSDTVPSLSFDTSGNITGLVGPGGVRITPKHGRTFRLAGLGDSITSLCQSSSASTKYLQSYGFIPWAMILSKQAVSYSFSDNFGVGGDTTTQVLARVSSVIAAAPDICTVHCGTNDIYGGVPYATTIANLASIWAALVGAGITVIAIPILPRAKDSASGLLPLAQRYMIQRINAWIRANAPATPNVYLADPTPNIVDYTATGSNLGDPIGGTSAAVTAYTYDGLHPANMGGFWMGKAVADVLALLTVPPGVSFKSPVDVYNATDNPNGNVLLNGHLSGTGGTLSSASGTVATSWTLQQIAGSVTGSNTALTLENGATIPQQNIVLGASSTAKMYQQRASLGGLSPGDSVYAEIDVTVTNPVNLNTFFLQLDDATTTTRCLNPVVSSYFPGQSWTGVLRTPTFTLGSSATMTTWLQLATSAGGSVTVDVRDWNVRKSP